MQFVYDALSGEDILELKEDNFNYLIKARRHKIGDEIYFRNLLDDNIYLYKIFNIGKKSTELRLISKESKIVESQKEIHLAWCVIDPKIIEKSISSLNEIGVQKITFVYSDYSQKNFKINIEKLEKILINSSSQCGRSSIIKLDICKNLEEFLKTNEDAYILDFSSINIEDKKSDIKTLIIGPEGGFSKTERAKFKDSHIVGFDTKLILKSETAMIGVASKIVL